MRRKLLSLAFQSIVFLGLGLLAFWFLIITQF
jgi:cell division septal protein FtsQ